MPHPVRLRRSLAALALALIASTVTLAQQGWDSANVLILLSGHKELPWQVNLERGMQAQIKEYEERGRKLPNLYIERLDLFRNPAQDNDTRLLDIQAKYADVPFELVLTETVPAGRLVQNTPAFYPKKTFYEKPGFISFNESGVVGREHVVSLTNDPSNTIKAIKGLMPDLGRVIVIGNYSKEINRLVVGRVMSLTRKTAEVWSDDFTYDELLQRVAELKPNDAIIYTLVMVDSTGKTFIPLNVATELASTAGAPIFTIWDSVIGTGIVGGYVLSGELVGRRLVQTALVPSTNWGMHDFCEYTFDKTALDRWNFSVNALPATSTLINAPDVEEPWYQFVLDYFD